ncbi:DMT family transporter [Paraburkholderia flava]|uniref:DMT family transporter n=1 Tax=Paraburkholderia flava TaxID=2547393 RepID=UPI00106038CB|nr:DMT family transporter [Paraburkholderia flava]
MSSQNFTDARPVSAGVTNVIGVSMRSVAALLLLAVMWGLSIPVTKLGLETLPPLTLTALRFAIAVPLLLAFAVGRHPLPWRALPRVAALGVLGIGVGQVAQTYGVSGTSASVGTIISATIPVFIVFFAAVRLGQHVSTTQKLGLVAAFAGIALVALGHGHGATRMSQTTAGGASCILLSALAIAFYYVWSVELTTAYGTATVAAWSTLFGFLALMPWAAWEMLHVPIHLTAHALGAAAYLGVVVTVAGLFLWLNLLRIVPARVAASVQYLQPVVGIAAASAMFGDRLGPWFVAGVVLVLGGLALTMSSRNRAG